MPKISPIKSKILKMHILIDNFLHIKQTSKEDLDSFRDPIENALTAIQAALYKKLDSANAFSMAQSAPLDHKDTDLMVLFLAQWANLSIRENRLNEANTLINRIKTFQNESTTPEILAYIYTVEGLVASKEGNKEKREKLLKEGLAILSINSPRRHLIVLDLAYFLAQQGRCLEIKKDVDDFFSKTNSKLNKGRVALIQFTDCVTAGRIQEANHWATIIEKDPNILETYSFLVENYRTHSHLLKLMEGKWLISDKEKKDYFKIPVSYLETESTPEFYAQTIRALLGYCTQEALTLARSHPKMKEMSFSGIGFESYNLIRSELAFGNGQAAMRLLDIRKEKGNLHYLDNFFSARAELLLEDFDAAGRAFATALKDSERYKAEGRLGFELRMACEMAPGVLTKLFKFSSQYTHLKDTEILQKNSIKINKKGNDLIIGDTSQMNAIKDTIQHFSQLDIPVLITGETGTGKELVSRALHDEGNRKDKPFIAVNCGAIADTLLESELYGHERGAFTGALKTHKGFFEEAKDGTLFLDEIGDISQRLQVSLLRVLESAEIRPIGSSISKKINCRIVFATNANLLQMVEDNLFRKDLYYRLKRLEINLPSLKNRKEDIPLLINHFLTSGRSDKKQPNLSDDLSKALIEYSWPGNIRELHNTIENMRMLNSEKLSYEINDLPPFLKIPKKPSHQDFKSKQSISTRSNLSEKVSQGDIEDSPILTNSSFRREEKIKDLFLEHKTLTRSEVAKYLKITPKTTTSYLKKLCNKDIIEKVEPTSSPRTHYFRVKQST